LDSDNKIERFGGWLSYVATLITAFICVVVFRAFNITRVYGRKNIPFQKKGVLYVSNHQTMYDSFFIGVAGFFPELILHPGLLPLNFAAKENYFSRWYSRILMRLLRTVPVKGRNDPWLMRKYLAYLLKHNLLIFYQGTRSHDLDVVKNGPGWIVAHSDEKLIVVPVFIEGVSKVFGGPKTKGFWGRWFPKSILRQMVVAFGTKIDFSDLRSIEDTRAQVVAVNDRIITTIKNLQTQYTLK
jgi:1-acyl-sn-glycerol-3-phosphate acyltransferase